MRLCAPPSAVRDRLPDGEHVSKPATGAARPQAATRERQRSLLGSSVCRGLHAV